MLSELSYLHNCNNTLFFEARRHEDLYMWAVKSPNGPSIRMHVQNIHTMDELKMTGNCLKGSRGIVSFDATFDQSEWGKLTKEVFTHVSCASCYLGAVWGLISGPSRSSRCLRPLDERNHLLTISSPSRCWMGKYGSEIFRWGVIPYSFPWPENDLWCIDCRERSSPTKWTTTNVSRRNRSSICAYTYKDIRGGLQWRDRLFESWFDNPFAFLIAGSPCPPRVCLTICCTSSGAEGQGYQV